MSSHSSPFDPANRLILNNGKHVKNSIHVDAEADFTHGIDRVLKSICEKIQLSPTQYELAVYHYEAVSRWLEAEGSILAIYEPKIYPQGSLPTDTTTKPQKKEEYDLDFICELNIDSREISPEDLFSKVEYRIREHDGYKNRMELGKRCISLIYAHDFHLDIVPACTNAFAGYGQVRIPDRELQNWKDTNSLQYVEWFNEIAQRYSGRVDAAAPVPPQEDFDKKSTLKFAVQLIKRHRDIAFEEKSDLAPVSMVLSTLAAEVYSGNTSVFETVTEILSSIDIRIQQAQGRLVVWNPVNAVQEDLGERWDNNPEAYKEFKAWVTDFLGLWRHLEQIQGYEQIGNLLMKLFGEHPAQEAIREEAQRLNLARKVSILGTVAGSGILTTQKPEIIAPENTFYGGN